MTGMLLITKAGGCGGGGGGACGEKESRRAASASAIAAEDQESQLSFVTLLLAALRKSMLSSCKLDESAEFRSIQNMEIGWPTNVQHLTHVTFDRFHGFLGLPVEFQVEIPCRVPSARSLLFPFLFSVCVCVF